MDDLTPAVPSRITHLAAAFSHPEPMRRGSLCERRMKCGQGACACQHDPKAAHGPYFLLTQKVEGKTRSRYEIGRASCRERVKLSVLGVSSEHKRRKIHGASL